MEWNIKQLIWEGIKSLFMTKDKAKIALNEAIWRITVTILALYSASSIIEMQMIEMPKQFKLVGLLMVYLIMYLAISKTMEQYEEKKDV